VLVNDARLIIPAGGGDDVEPSQRQCRWVHQLMQVTRKSQGWPFCRVVLHLGRNDFGQRIAEVVAWPRRMHLIGETRWEQVSVSADNVCPDTHLGDGLDGAEPMRQASTGVQRNRLPHRGDPGFVHPMVTQEARRGVGTVDFESLIAVGVLGDPEVVQDAAEEYQFVVIVDIRLQSLGSGELTAAGRCFDRVAAGERIQVVRGGRLLAQIVAAGSSTVAPSSADAGGPIDLDELRAHTGRYLDRVAAGDTIEVVRGGGVVARIVSADGDTARRPDPRVLRRTPNGRLAADPSEFHRTSEAV